MTDSILDNQEVTAEILNNISIDLGNDDLTFTSTEKFGADKLNKITGDLVGSGILSGGSNQGNNCKIYISDGKIYIKSGIMVFADGKKKTIENDTEISELQDCAVYALNNTSLNTIQIIAGTSYPSSGDFVKLATVSGGKVTDDRCIAVPKVNALGSRTSQTITNVSLGLQTEIPLNSSKVGVIYGVVGIGSSNQSFAYNFTDNKYVRFTTNSMQEVDYITVGTNTRISFSIIDNKLIVTSSTGGGVLNGVII